MNEAILIILILVTASFSLIREELLKFLISGHSATNNIIVVRHSYFVVFGISIIPVLCILFLGKKNWASSLFVMSWLTLILSLRTFAIDTSQRHPLLISGISFFPISKCEITEMNRCNVSFTFFLGDKIDQVMKANVEY
jgi:hypothetical protein